jgi:hypothetical protein
MTPTPETGTARIRWSDDLADARHFIGHVGTVAEPAFKLYGPIDGSDRWLLSIRLRSAVEFVYRDDPDELKADAERLLSEFVSSLGAVFPEDAGRRREEVLRKFAPPAPTRPHVAPVETGEPWRGPARADWDGSR